MRSRGSRSALVLLLTAVILLGGAMPPAVQHAHAHGDQPHRHEVAQPASHDSHGIHRHASGEQHGHSHGEKAQSLSSLDASVAHCHISFFGWDICLPVTADESVPVRPENADHRSFMLVRVTDTDLLLSSPRAAERLFTTIPVHTVVAGQPLVRGGRRGSFIFDAPCLLCDTARHERSGVQLI